ncbi:palmitoleoyl-protein carboxylesterase NOTUM isoform X2 [Elephas maximus indicus]|uniref:palmitoleoyl-protein carboxylesterase NOTUM isoform X2 n=1 Tax=Elephas maximus indicus TaxID=99487 RepID=UPI0021164EDE|nr:palmitoleoyl-protein carboxylesterase NOTUM isoform X2 [Elephas maximus indicus]XP_049716660.1 palmitoleoyl-protein carboxylesterase NOTUM isoform X2 [Elephas maximus indicus]XP_049716661.1 palmitoleoyl-protein carboxylesterase NOTUM isoform X2 [Elephas maximus indicus]
MGRGVRLLLLLSLLHWGGGEGRKTWRRRGQQPPPPPPPPLRAEAAQAAGQPVESFPLDFTAVEGNMDSFMAQVKSLAQSLYPCSAQQLNEDLRLHLLLNTSVTCNDGSPAGYYLKESKGSRRWLLFLEGGWYCFNRENCDSRYDTMRRLMSSKDWPRTRTGTGILSSQPEENPHWWNANMVFIPYCSSDVWSGTSSKSEKNEYAFMGALIIREVVQELLAKGLSGARVLLLAGSSAGGTGVLLNVDRVAEQLEELGYPAIQVRGLADSGWFLDNKQYRRTDCVDTVTCAPTEAIRRGIRYWKGMVPERCRRQFKEGEEWNCFFGYKVYPTLRRPVFVVQWLFDEAQLTVDNVHLTGQPVQEGQWLYIQNLGRQLRDTLKDVVASFAPACLSHEIIIRSHWTDVQVKGTSLPRALHCWDRSLHDSHKASRAPLKGCPVHLVDSCPWPHCNPSCPTIRDQFTGQEMNVAQFLMHMGFDVQTVAQQQGLEPSSLHWPSCGLVTLLAHRLPPASSLQWRGSQKHWIPQPPQPRRPLPACPNLSYLFVLFYKVTFFITLIFKKGK